MTRHEAVSNLCSYYDSLIAHRSNYEELGKELKESGDKLGSKDVVIMIMKLDREIAKVDSILKGENAR